MSIISTPAGRQLLQWGIRKVVLLLVIVTAFAGLFGCSGKPEPPAEDLSVVSTSCGHMSRTESYSFSAIRKDGVWMFSTRCYADREKFYVELEDCPMTDEEAGELLRIVAEEDLIHTVHSFRKPLLARIIPPRDAAMDSTLLRFADGTEYDGEVSIGNDLTAFFYRLAEQYGREAAQAEMASVRALTVSCSHSYINGSFQFSINRETTGWLFSCRCYLDLDEQVQKDNCPITDEQAAEILQVAWEEGLLHRVRAYQKPTDGLFAYDAPEYSTFFAFTDGSSVDAPINPSSEVVGAFRQLATQYR